MCRGLTTYDLKAARSIRIIQQHTGQGTVGVLHCSGGSFVALHADPDRTGPDHTAEMTDGIVGTVFIDCAGCSIGQDRCMTEVPKVVGPALTIQKQVPIKEALTSVVQIMQIIAGITGILDSRTGKASAKSSQTWAPWPERERFSANGTPCAADAHNGAGAGLPIGVIEGQRQQIAGLFRQHGAQADNIPALCVPLGQVAVDGGIVRWLVPRCSRTVIVYGVRIMT